jgi:hypothetical protein
VVYLTRHTFVRMYSDSDGLGLLQDNAVEKINLVKTRSQTSGADYEHVVLRPALGIKGNRHFRNAVSFRGNDFSAVGPSCEVTCGSDLASLVMTQGQNLMTSITKRMPGIHRTPSQAVKTLKNLCRQPNIWHS